MRVGAALPGGFTRKVYGFLGEEGFLLWYRGIHGGFTNSTALWRAVRGGAQCEAPLVACGQATSTPLTQDLAALLSSSGDPQRIDGCYHMVVTWDSLGICAVTGGGVAVPLSTGRTGRCPMPFGQNIALTERWSLFKFCEIMIGVAHSREPALRSHGGTDPEMPVHTTTRSWCRPLGGIAPYNNGLVAPFALQCQSL